MPQPKTTAPSPEEVKRAFVDLAFDEAYIIREELYGREATDDDDGKVGLYARRKANREQLRQLAAQNFLDAEQREELNELYPKREKSESEAENEAEQTKPADDEPKAA